MYRIETHNSFDDQAAQTLLKVDPLKLPNSSASDDSKRNPRASRYIKHYMFVTSGILALTVVSVGFQNCAPSFNAMNEQQSKSSASSVGPRVSSAKFAEGKVELRGSSLDSVRSISGLQDSTAVSFSILSQTGDLLIAALNTSAILKLGLPLLLSLETANAQTTVSLSIDLNQVTLTNFKSTGITDNSISNTMTLSQTGQVGIGTANPDFQSTFQVMAQPGKYLGVAFTNSDYNVTTKTGTGVWVGLQAVSGDTAGVINAYTQGGAGLGPLGLSTSGGGVGIGTVTPKATLDVKGTVRLSANASAPSACTNANDGTIARTSRHTLCMCNGLGAWISVSDGISACNW